MRRVITCYVPSITYQYSETGDLDNGVNEFPFDPDVRAKFKSDFIAQWSKTRFPGVWDRLVELVKGQLGRLPDNPFVLADAWMVGLIDEAPERVQGWLTLYERETARCEEEAREEAEWEAIRADLRSRMTCRVLSSGTDPDEGNGTPYARVEVTVTKTGERLRFSCRNVFDFGYVINPLYALVPGAEPGGLANVDKWMEFEPDKGWFDLRPMTPAELLAYQYLSEFPPVPSAVRM